MSPFSQITNGLQRGRSLRDRRCEFSKREPESFDSQSSPFLDERTPFALFTIRNSQLSTLNSQLSIVRLPNPRHELGGSFLGTPVGPAVVGDLLAVPLVL